jgi:hypothetical protein
LTLVPAMWNPCAVSSLLTRISISSPASTTICDGVKAKRSALTRTTRRCVWDPASAPGSRRAIAIARPVAYRIRTTIRSRY